MAAVAGCGAPATPTGLISGMVTLDGTNLASGVITFEDPARGLGQSATITAGAYTMASAMKVGEYKVAVQGPPPPAPTARRNTEPKVAIPAKYTIPANSELVATVKAGRNKHDFKLTK